MDELGTALQTLARSAQVPLDSPADLWVAGRRRVRRRRVVASTLVAAVVAIVGVGTIVVPTPTIVMPAGPVHAPAFPQNLYDPSKWLAGTDDEGPLGQLALIARAERGRTSGIFGVSSTTGEYRFLDLPDRIAGSPVTLAPDGKHVAYWIAGSTTKEPYPDPSMMEGDKRSIAGVAIYDSESGAVDRGLVPTLHGMTAEELSWIDNTTVVFPDWQLKTRTEGGRSRNLTLEVGSSEPRDATAGEEELLTFHRNADGSYLVPLYDGGRWEVIPVRSGAGERDQVKLPDALPGAAPGTETQYLYVARADNRVVLVPDAGAGLVDPLMTGQLAPDGTAGGLEAVEPLYRNVSATGWLDDHTLLFTGFSEAEEKVQVVSLDVRSGEHAVQGRDELTWPPSVVPAVEVLRNGLVRGLRPPDPMDPRLTSAGLIAGGLALLGVALVLVRRRRHDQT